MSAEASPATPFRLRMKAIDVENVLHVLGTRLGSYSVQYGIQCKTVKNLLRQTPSGTNVRMYHRIILRGNRNAAYISQAKYFTRIGFLGAGGFGTVELVKSKAPDGKYYALKTILAKPNYPLSRFHTLSLIERDCALMLDSQHIVKMKAAWVELNTDGYDCFKFLLENMPYGDMYQLIRQLHPLTAKKNVRDEDTNSPIFTFSPLTHNDVIGSVNLESRYGSSHPLLGHMLSENFIIRSSVTMGYYLSLLVTYMKQIIDGVDFIHQKGITHRDLKPANILVDRHMNLKISDLGLAAAMSHQHLQQMHEWSNRIWRPRKSLTRHVILRGAREAMRTIVGSKTRLTKLGPVGTRSWQPPEHEEQYYDLNEGRRFPKGYHPPSDWFAVGAIIFQLLTGIQPVDHGLRIFCSVAFGSFRDELTRDRMRTIMRMRPHRFNPLIYRAHNMAPDHFEDLFLDMRIHSIARNLMNPDPDYRYNRDKVLADVGYMNLQDETVHATLTWNELLARPKQSVFASVISDFEAGSPAADSESPRRGRRIAHLPAFPIMTASPGTIASPVISPLSRGGEGGARGVKRPSPLRHGVSFDDSGEYEAAEIAAAAAEAEAAVEAAASASVSSDDPASGTPDAHEPSPGAHAAPIFLPGHAEHPGLPPPASPSPSPGPHDFAAPVAPAVPVAAPAAFWPPTGAFARVAGILSVAPPPTAPPPPLPPPPAPAPVPSLPRLRTRFEVRTVSEAGAVAAAPGPSAPAPPSVAPGPSRDVGAAAMAAAAATPPHAPPATSRRTHTIAAIVPEAVARAAPPVSLPGAPPHPPMPINVAAPGFLPPPAVAAVPPVFFPPNLTSFLGVADAPYVPPVPGMAHLLGAGFPPTVGHLPGAIHLPAAGYHPGVGHLPVAGHHPGVGHVPGVGHFPMAGHPPTASIPPMAGYPGMGHPSVAGYPGMGHPSVAGYPGMGHPPVAGYPPGMGLPPGAGHFPRVGHPPVAGYPPGMGLPPGAGHFPRVGHPPAAGFAPGAGHLPRAGHPSGPGFHPYGSHFYPPH